MENKFVILNSTIHALGVLATIFCVCWCAWVYSLNEDVTLVVQKTFGENEEFITPSFTLCFTDLYLDEKFANNELKMDYESFLSGKKWDYNMSKINFEDVTKNLEDYVEGYWVMFKNMTNEYFDSRKTFPDWFKRTYLSYAGFFLGRLQKCYSFDMHLESLTLALLIRKEIFPNKIRPKTMGLTVSIHYPNQFLSSFSNAFEKVFSHDLHVRISPLVLCSFS